MKTDEKDIVEDIGEKPSQAAELPSEETPEAEFTDKVIAIRRVAKVVAGGRRFRFTSLVASGNGQGLVGMGHGKAREAPDAIRKAAEQARREAFHVPIQNDTIPFDVEGKFGPSRVILKRARPGTGIIAGGAVRAFLELAGIRNILTKSLGSRNPYNVAQATIEALREISQIMGARHEA